MGRYFVVVVEYVFEIKVFLFIYILVIYKKALYDNIGISSHAG